MVHTKKSLFFRLITFTLMLVMALTLVLPVAVLANSSPIDDVTDEPGTADDGTVYPTKVFVYGGSQSEAELSMVKAALDVDKLDTAALGDDYTAVSIDKATMEHYVGAMPNIIGVWSSVYIERLEEGSGIEVEIRTPENITRVTYNQYLNAVLSLGLDDVRVLVASSAEAYGEGALSGVYVGADLMGVGVDSDQTRVVQEELNEVTAITEEADLDEEESEDFTQALAEIKHTLAEMADKEQLTKEDIKEVVTDVLENYELKFNEEQLDRIIGIMEKLYDSGILAREETRSALSNFADKFNLDGLGKKSKNIFVRFWNWLKDWINKIIDSFKNKPDSSTVEEPSSAIEEPISEEEEPPSEDIIEMPSPVEPDEENDTLPETGDSSTAA